MSYIRISVCYVLCIFLYTNYAFSTENTPRKAFVHFGPPKTGSTIIQNTLSYNKPALQKVGYCYIDREDYWYNGVAKYYYAIFYGQNPPEEDYLQALNALKTLIDKLPPHCNLIISHENFIGSSDLTKFETFYPQQRKTFSAVKKMFSELGMQSLSMLFKPQDLDNL